MDTIIDDTLTRHDSEFVTISNFWMVSKERNYQFLFARLAQLVRSLTTNQGPFVRRWVKFNPELGETLNIILSSYKCIWSFQIIIEEHIK